MSGFGYIDEESFRRLARQVREAETTPRADGIETEPVGLAPGTRYLARLDDTLNAGGNVTAKIRAGDPLEDTNITVDAYDDFLAPGDTLAGGTKVKLDWIAGHLYVTAAGCNSSTASSS